MKLSALSHLVQASLWPCDTIFRNRSFVNIGSGNGLLPDGTKPLPEPMLTRDCWYPSQCNVKICSKYAGKNFHSKLSFLKIFMHMPGANELKTHVQFPYDFRLNLNFELISWGFGKFPIVMSLWACMNMSTILILYPCFQYWSWYRRQGRVSEYLVGNFYWYLTSRIQIFLYPQLQWSWKGGILVSPCPSVRLWTHCIFNNTRWIHFIFAHLIKQLQKVCRV